MSTATWRGDGFKIEISREIIEFSTRGHHEIDPKWNVTDAAGHTHSSLDTLVWAVTGTYWCGQCNDEHEEGEYRCRECGEPVEPAFIFKGPDFFRVPGLTTTILRMDDGRVFYLRGEELTLTWPPSAEWLDRVVARGPDEWQTITFSRGSGTEHEATDA